MDMKNPAHASWMKEVAILSAILLLYTITVIDSIYSHLMPAGDEPAYLKTSIFLKENGGPLNFISLCINRVYLESNRQPIPLLILSLFAGRDPYFFFVGKVISGIFSILFLLTYYVLVSRRFGFQTGVIATGIVMTNVVLITYSGHATCETMLTLFTFLTWYLTLKGFEDNRYWMAAGFMNGIAYMTKGSGLFLAAPFAVSCLVRYKSKVLGNRWFYCYFCMLIIASSPLLARNLLVYGNPLYHASHDVLWFDKWVEYTRLDYGYKVSFSDYMDAHGLLDIMSRLATGLVIATFNTLVQVGGFLGLVFAYLLIVGIRGHGSETKTYVATLVLAYLLFFGWYYPIDPDFRFELPIAPILAAYAAGGVVSGLGSKSGFIKTISQMAVVYLSLMLVLLSLIAVLDLRERQKEEGYLRPYIIPKDYRRIMDYFESNMVDGDKMVVVDGSTYFEYYWTSSKLSKANIMLYPYRIGESPEVFLRGYNITYMLATKGLFEMDPRIGEYLGYDDSRGLYEKKELLGYRVVFRDENAPAQYLVYKKVG